MVQRMVVQLIAAWKDAWRISPLHLKVTLVISLVASYLFSLVLTWEQWIGFAVVTIPFTLFILLCGPMLLRSSAVMSSGEESEREDVPVIGIMVAAEVPQKRTEPGLQAMDDGPSEL